MIARANDDSKDEEAADEAKAKVIQWAALDCLWRMLGQPAGRLNVEDLDDLGLLQRDLDWMKARMMPRGCKWGSGRQGLLIEACAR
jgi:hypothetical protein